MVEQDWDEKDRVHTQRWYYVNPADGSTIGPINAFQMAGRYISKTAISENEYWVQV